MAKAILQLCASLFGYLAARGIDAIVGKWLAFVVIAWEERASDRSKAEYATAMISIKQDMPAKAAAWESWRRRAAEITT